MQRTFMNPSSHTYIHVCLPASIHVFSILGFPYSGFFHISTILVYPEIQKHGNIEI